MSGSLSGDNVVVTRLGSFRITYAAHLMILLEPDHLHRISTSGAGKPATLLERTGFADLEQIDHLTRNRLNPLFLRSDARDRVEQTLRVGMLWIADDFVRRSAFD